jgi:hypothetical protein
MPWGLKVSVPGPYGRLGSCFRNGAGFESGPGTGGVKERYRKLFQAHPDRAIEVLLPIVTAADR